MKEITTQAIPIFLGTLPLLGVILWNLLEFKDFKKEVREEFRLLRVELGKLKDEVSSIKERLATLEERDRVKLR